MNLDYYWWVLKGLAIRAGKAALIMGFGAVLAMVWEHCVR